MNLKNSLSKIRDLFPFLVRNSTKRNSSQLEEKHSPKVIDYLIECNLKTGIPLSHSNILQRILLNPWTTLISPQIDISTNEAGESQLRINFKVLKEDQGKEIEKEIRALVSQ